MTPAYEVAGATTTKQIYAGDTLLATISTNSPAPTLTFNHLDHLGSTRVLTVQDGYLTQVLDYYPYGDARIQQSYDTNVQPIQYVGTRHDTETDLSYMNARYNETKRGQFVSQDPVFWSTNQNLSNPQSLNSYSYAEGNPVNLKDPSGLSAKNASQEAANRQKLALQNQIIGLLKQQVEQITRDFFGSAARSAVNPVQGVKEAKNTSDSSAKRTGSAIGTSISSYGFAASVVRAPVQTIGATLGVAQRYSDDKRSGNRSTPVQYLGSAAFGAGTAVYTQGSTLPSTITRVTGASFLENYILDGSAQPGNVASNVAASVAGRYTGNVASTPQVSETLSGVTEFAVYKTVSDYLAY